MISLSIYITKYNCINLPGLKQPITSTVIFITFAFGRLRTVIIILSKLIFGRTTLSPGSDGWNDIVKHTYVNEFYKARDKNRFFF